MSDATKKKWYQQPVIYVIFSVFGSVIFLVTSYYQNAKMDRIHHRLDVNQAYMYKSLIDGSEAREQAWREEKERNTQILAFCEINKCGLPFHLKGALPDRHFEPIEKAMRKGTTGEQH